MRPGARDVISLNGLEMTLEPITENQEAYQTTLRTKAGKDFHPSVTLVLLSLFQVFMTLQLLFTAELEDMGSIALGFGSIFAIQWLLFAFYCAIRRRGYEVETIAFFLSTLGMALIATADPGEAGKQIAAMVLGLGLFLFLGWSLRDLERAKKVRYLAAGLRPSAAGGEPGVRRGEVRREELDQHRTHVLPALRAGENLLCPGRRLHHGPDCHQAKPGPCSLLTPVSFVAAWFS